jgi:hypothetical protein
VHRRRNTILAVLLLIISAAAVGGGLVALLKTPPTFYGSCGPSLEADALVGPVVMTKFADLKNAIRSRPEWSDSFTAEELNAFFRDSLGSGGSLAAFLPEGVTEPRVQIDGDRIRLGVRYGEGFWSSILSVELRAWLVKPQPEAADINTVALEIVGIWAGRIPVGTQTVLETVTESARDSNIAVSWYRYQGHPVGVFRFYADQPIPPTQIRRLQIADGKVSIAGRSYQDQPGGVPSATAAQNAD